MGCTLRLICHLWIKMDKEELYFSTMKDESYVNLPKVWGNMDP